MTEADRLLARVVLADLDHAAHPDDDARQRFHDALAEAANHLDATYPDEWRTLDV